MVKERNKYTLKIYAKGKLVKVFRNQTHRDIIVYKRLFKQYRKLRAAGTVAKVDIIDKKTGKIKWVRYLTAFK